MNVLLLTAMFLAQAAQALTGAAVTGVVRDSDGKSLSGVRVAAMATPGTRGNSTPVSSALTDPTGHYRLTVPPGPYFIVAGNVNNPTFYPGVGGRKGAAIISIESGSAASELDFVLFAVRGVVRNREGKPLPEVRVAAIGTSNFGGVDNVAEAPIIIGKTDDTGHYRLEVPPGRYYVSAGRVGRSTYFPGTAEARNAASITVGFGAGSSGLDFLISEETTETRPEDLYLSAVELANFGRYDASRLLLQTFISTYTQSEYVPQAKYAIADSLYRERTSESMTAARSLFEEYVRMFPNDPHVPEARQKLTEIQEKTGRKDP